MWGIMHKLDATDLRLLQALNDDPSATFVAFAERLSLSRNTVQARMTRLGDANVFLGADRRFNTVALGYPLSAFVTVHVRQRLLSEITAALADIPEVIQAFGVSGEADLLVRVVCINAEDLFRIDSIILHIEGVERTETNLSMGELIPYRLSPLIERALNG